VPLSSQIWQRMDCVTRHIRHRHAPRRLLISWFRVQVPGRSHQIDGKQWVIKSGLGLPSSLFARRLQSRHQSLSDKDGVDGFAAASACGTGLFTLAGITGPLPIVRHRAGLPMSGTWITDRARSTAGSAGRSRPSTRRGCSKVERPLLFTWASDSTACERLG
jgi:hypothetical protein